MKDSKKIVSIILKSVGLAMGIGVFVLNILGTIEIEDSIKLLSLGMIANGLYLFQKKG